MERKIWNLIAVIGGIVMGAVNFLSIEASSSSERIPVGFGWAIVYCCIFLMVVDIRYRTIEKRKTRSSEGGEIAEDED